MSEQPVSLRDIYRAVERVEDKMDRRLESVENDIDSLKAFQNKALGIAGISAGVVTLITNFIFKRLFGDA